LGLYYWWWAYRVSKEVDEFLGESDIPPVVHFILLIVTAGLWWYVWDFLLGRKIARMRERLDMPVNDPSWLYLALDIIGAGPVAGLGILNFFLQQHELNQIWRRAAVQRERFVYGSPYAV
jgi:hypothetical protein